MTFINLVIVGILDVGSSNLAHSSWYEFKGLVIEHSRNDTSRSKQAKLTSNSILSSKWGKAALVSSTDSILGFW